MNCTEFERTLHEAVESRQTPDSMEFRSHVEHCSACLALWSDFLILDQVVPPWKRRTNDVDLVDRVVAQMRVQTSADLVGSVGADGVVPQPRIGVRQRWAVVAIAAAVLLLLLRPFGLGLQTSTPNSERDLSGVRDAAVRTDAGSLLVVVADGVPKFETRAGGQDEIREVDAFIEDAGSVYMGLAREAADTVRDVAFLFPTFEEQRVSVEPESTLPNWLDDFGENLQPIGRDVENAIEFLLDAVPGDSHPKTGQTGSSRNSWPMAFIHGVEITVMPRMADHRRVMRGQGGARNLQLRGTLCVAITQPEQRSC